ncbi:hypothetical protein SAMN05216276_1001284 [Streptosporangium subroseum]|uniref:Uncharacterized protein n=1 Tax=Streptosporangium subroseum TaxID=106412 RepID=A0A239ACN9_9ACTN|nr:hypothetical protein [Streptosporangium subroseum]SNR93101.1 hypothetical protein SAMN05216276_1001284 [Streptosporangium subroseum]
MPVLPSTTRRTWATAVSLVIALSTVILTVPASASSADISGYQVRYATSDSNSNDKGAEVTCPEGTRVLGTGAEIISVIGAVVIDEVIPTTYTVSAYGVETEEGTTANWSIRVRAVCGDPHESTRILSRISPLNGMIPVSVTCDTGEFLLGTGYQLEGARGTASLDYVIPQLNMVYAHAVNRYPATYTDWTLRVFAICAEDPPPGLWIYSETSQSTQSNKPPVEVACGGAGDRQVVLGTGFSIGNGHGEVTLDYFIPTSDKVLVRAAEMEPMNDYWTVRAYAICAWEQ